MTNTVRVEGAVRPRKRSERILLAAAVLLFCASGTVTVRQCLAMADMPGMAMPGGWQMSMTWMRMPGQGWSGAGMEFIAMWTLMMVAMMLPPLLPMLHRYRAAACRHAGGRLDRLTAIVAAGYFAVWTFAGLVAYAAGSPFATLLMQWPAASRAVPFATALLAIVVGAVQFSAMKARQLESCARVPCVAADGVGAWRHGLRLGWRCCRCCAGFTVLLLACGVMDLIVMSLVTAAIAAERLAPRGARMARLSGAIVVVLGAWWALQAVGSF